jgi:hypothetical protein
LRRIKFRITSTLHYYTTILLSLLTRPSFNYIIIFDIYLPLLFLYSFTQEILLDHQPKQPSTIIHSFTSSLANPSTSSCSPRTHQIYNQRRPCSFQYRSTAFRGLWSWTIITSKRPTAFHLPLTTHIDRNPTTHLLRSTTSQRCLQYQSHLQSTSTF